MSAAHITTHRSIHPATAHTKQQSQQHSPHSPCLPTRVLSKNLHHRATHMRATQPTNESHQFQNCSQLPTPDLASFEGIAKVYTPGIKNRIECLGNLLDLLQQTSLDTKTNVIKSINAFSHEINGPWRPYYHNGINKGLVQGDPQKARILIFSDNSALLSYREQPINKGTPVFDTKALFIKDKQYCNGHIQHDDIACIIIEPEYIQEICEQAKELFPNLKAFFFEDINNKAFSLMKQLEQDNMPVFFDDYHATSVVSTAFILYQLAKMNISPTETLAAIVGAGPSGIGVFKMLSLFKLSCCAFDTKGLIYKQRIASEQDPKHNVAIDINPENHPICLEQIAPKANILIDLANSKAFGETAEKRISLMRALPKNAIVLSLSNPKPAITSNEIHNQAGRPDIIYASGNYQDGVGINNAAIFTAAITTMLVALDKKQEDIQFNTFKFLQMHTRCLQHYLQTGGKLDPWKTNPFVINSVLETLGTSTK